VLSAQSASIGSRKPVLLVCTFLVPHQFQLKVAYSSCQVSRLESATATLLGGNIDAIFDDLVHRLGGASDPDT
jgi:hypothetical protein